MKKMVNIKLLKSQKSVLLAMWNRLQAIPIENKVEIQTLDGVINLLDCIGDSIEDEGECVLIGIEGC